MADATPEHPSTSASPPTSPGVVRTRPAFEPGAVVNGRYRVIELLGRGGMGEVYKAEDLMLDELVALKFLPVHVARSATRLERLHAEVRIARQVTHPNVCRVFDIGDVGGDPFITMEYIDGEDLSSLLRRIGRLPDDKAIDIARQLCAGVAAAHDRGVIHRDLKPANVMIDGRGKVKITDFGIARVGEATGVDANAGTPAYMAPEQLSATEATVRSDIFSLGLVLYELTTGRRAYEAGTIEELMHLHESRPELPSQVIRGMDSMVERVILRCLEKDPAKRPQSALAIAAALPGADPLAAALAVGETPAPALVAAAQGGARLAPRTAVGLLLLALVGIGVSLFAGSRFGVLQSLDTLIEPAALEDRARSIVDAAGLDRGFEDSAGGYIVHDAEIERLARTGVPDPWAHLAGESQNALAYWYRQSPEPLVPRNRLGVVTTEDPPLHEPGMTLVKMNVQGRLVSLRSVPPVQASVIEPVPFDVLHRAAGIDITDWTPRDPSMARLLRLRPFVLVAPWPEPPVYVDERLVWTRDGSLIEGGRRQGRIVYYKVHHASFEVDDNQDSQAVFISGVLLVCALFAWRNFRTGRGDRRGATRLAAYVFVIWLAKSIALGHHVPEPKAEFQLIASWLGMSLFYAGAIWAMYMALEPFMRRRGSNLIVSWARLLERRFRDPLIARDVLIGMSMGSVLAGSMLSARLLVEPLGARATAPLGLSFLPQLHGLRWSVASFANEHLLRVLEAVQFTFFFLAVQTALAWMLRAMLQERHASRVSTVISVVIFLVLMVGAVDLPTPRDPVWLNVVTRVLMVGGLLTALFRFGLICGSVYLITTWLLVATPFTMSFGAWYAQPTLFAIAIAVGGAALATLFALGGPKVLGRMV